MRSSSGPMAPFVQPICSQQENGDVRKNIQRGALHPGGESRNWMGFNDVISTGSPGGGNFKHVRGGGTLNGVGSNGIRAETKCKMGAPRGKRYYTGYGGLEHAR